LSDGGPKGPSENAVVALCLRVCYGGRVHRNKRSGEVLAACPGGAPEKKVLGIREFGAWAELLGWLIRKVLWPPKVSGGAQGVSPEEVA
jgi:hypothetical protein